MKALIGSMGIKKVVRYCKLWFALVPLIAVSIAAIVLLLSCIYTVAIRLADGAGYVFILTEELQKTVIAVAGVVLGAVVAFVGVGIQNDSANSRHLRDKELELMKDIFIEAAAALVLANNTLVGLGSGKVTDDLKELQEEEKSRVELIGKTGKKISAAFAKVSMVGNREVITAMLAANEMFARSMMPLRFAETGYKPGSPQDCLKRYRLAINASMQYVPKAHAFVVVAREQLGIGFIDSDAFLDDMSKSTARLNLFVDEIIRALEAALSEQTGEASSGNN
jgi:hypothetical protein